MKYRILLWFSKYRKWKTAEEYEEIIGLKHLKSKKQTLWFEDKSKGKYWMALSPEINKLSGQKTKYKISYWVNYGDDNTYGWFTVEQIIKWLSEPDTKLHTLGGNKER